MSEIPPGGLPQHRKLVERCRAAAAAESADVRADEWRNVGVERRTTTFAGLFDMSVIINRNRPIQREREPLDYPRFSSTKPR